MANRRMFSLRITSSGRFLKLPPSTQALYFHLCMRADDDGIVEAYPVLNMLGTSETDLKVLVATGFVYILNDDLVTFITDWKEHNVIRADRKVNSIYQGLLVQILPEINLIIPKPRSDLKRKTNNTLSGPSMDNQRSAQDRLGKVNKKIYTKKIFKENKDQILEEAQNLYPEKDCNRVLNEFLEGIEIKDYKYKNYKLAFYKWVRNSNHRAQTKPNLIFK